MELDRIYVVDASTELKPPKPKAPSKSRSTRAREGGCTRKYKKTSPGMGVSEGTASLSPSEASVLIGTADDETLGQTLASSIELTSQGASLASYYSKYEGPGLILEDLFGLGCRMYDKGNLSGASEQFKKLIELDATHVPALISLGNVLADIGDFDNARKQYVTAIKLEPHNKSAQHFLDALFAKDAVHNPFQQQVILWGSRLIEAVEEDLSTLAMDYHSLAKDASATRQRLREDEEELVEPLARELRGLAPKYVADLRAFCQHELWNSPKPKAIRKVRDKSKATKVKVAKVRQAYILQVPNESESPVSQATARASAGRSPRKPEWIGCENRMLPAESIPVRTLSKRPKKAKYDEKREEPIQEPESSLLPLISVNGKITPRAIALLLEATMRVSSQRPQTRRKPKPTGKKRHGQSFWKQAYAFLSSSSDGAFLEMLASLPENWHRTKSTALRSLRKTFADRSLRTLGNSIENQPQDARAPLALVWGCWKICDFLNSREKLHQHQETLMEQRASASRINVKVQFSVKQYCSAIAELALNQIAFISKHRHTCDEVSIGSASRIITETVLKQACEKRSMIQDESRSFSHRMILQARQSISQKARISDLPAEPLIRQKRSDITTRIDEISRGLPPLYSRTWTEGPGATDAGARVRVMHFNVLAEGLSASPNATPPFSTDLRGSRVQPSDFGGFTGIENAERILNFQGCRCWRILEEILRVQPDVLCMVECDHFYDFYEPVLSILGYRGYFTVRNESPGLRFGYHSDGVAIFWLAQRFKAGKPECIHSPPTIVVPFHDKTSGFTFVVASTHLQPKAGAANEVLRTDQIFDALGLMASMMVTAGTWRCILCGDLNTDPFDTEEQKAHTIPSVLLWDDCRLSSAYPLPGDSAHSWTTWKKHGKKEIRHFFDYIFHPKGPGGFSVSQIWDLPEFDEISASPSGLPDKRYPSDHASVAADFVFI